MEPPTVYASSAATASGPRMTHGLTWRRAARMTAGTNSVKAKRITFYPFERRFAMRRVLILLVAFAICTASVAAVVVPCGSSVIAID